jgi:hypothetical protein
MPETSPEVLTRVRRLVVDEEQAVRRLTELADLELDPMVRNDLEAAARSRRGQLAVDRKWLDDLERRAETPTT